MSGQMLQILKIFVASRRPRITMMPYGISPNEQIFNLMRVEKSQELFEVLMQFDLFHRPVFC